MTHKRAFIELKHYILAQEQQREIELSQLDHPYREGRSQQADDCAEKLREIEANIETHDR